MVAKKTSAGQRAPSKATRAKRKRRPARLGVLGWHFLPRDGRLRYSDGRRAEKGVALDAVGPLEVCHNGMHACKKLVDALNYACLLDIHNLARVRLVGEVVRGRGAHRDKHCGRTRTPLTEYVSVVKELREFVAWCARKSDSKCTYRRSTCGTAARYAMEDMVMGDPVSKRRQKRASQERELTRLVRKALRERG